MGHPEQPREYRVANIEKAWVEYDRQSDTLHIVFEDVEDADEEVLSEDGHIVYRIKEGRLVSLMILGFSEKVQATIL
ncbi:MAG: DUF2283 domain-containing protein [Desulfurococcaceae archaeon]